VGFKAEKNLLRRHISIKIRELARSDPKDPRADCWGYPLAPGNRAFLGIQSRKSGARMKNGAEGGLHFRQQQRKFLAKIFTYIKR